MTVSDYPTVYDYTSPKARKPHTCCECRGVIAAGEKYQLFKALYDDGFSSFKTCSDCDSLREQLCAKITDPEDRPAFGDLYQEVFESRNSGPEYILRFMEIRRKRNAIESMRRWMEKIEEELKKGQEPMKPELPEGLPMLPPVPEGFDRWEYRGVAYVSPGAGEFRNFIPGSTIWIKAKCARGLRHCHYIEAVAAPAVAEAGPEKVNPAKDGKILAGDVSICMRRICDTKGCQYPPNCIQPQEQEAGPTCERHGPLPHPYCVAQEQEAAHGVEDDDEKWLTIINGVTEDFVDQGSVSFATKKQLCETILWLTNRLDEKGQKASLEKSDGILSEISKAVAALEAEVAKSARIAELEGLLKTSVETTHYWMAEQSSQLVEIVKAEAAIEREKLGRKIGVNAALKAVDSVNETLTKLRAVADGLADVLNGELGNATICRCNEGYTIRDMHEPNSLCDLREDVLKALARYEAGKQTTNHTPL